MKCTLSIFLLSILTFGCSKNDFENTNLYLAFDKEAYQPNDNFELTVRIYPTETKKTIRLYKDLNNFEFAFFPKEGQLGFKEVLNERFIQGPSLTGYDSEYIDEFTITEKKPYEKKLLGTIYELENEILFEIPEMKIKDRIDKSILYENPTVLVKGNCRTVYGIEGKTFEPKEIKVVLE
ncbi:hypothetical protein [Flagellimonas meishanensis]|uniref:hypothetical protein n=1 Tax=Flagellimonas meishanensis TaxID=2873264 RepID=UPI001CA7A592|nr:hypothetical protein [[Muricauda] meishanensis]